MDNYIDGLEENGGGNKLLGGPPMRLLAAYV